MTRILCPTLIGRHEELLLLSHAAASAATGRGSVTALTGPAGIGKSRLVAETAAQARRHGLVVLRGRARPADAADPYRPIAEALVQMPALREILTSPGVGAFRQALRGLVGGDVDGEPGAAAADPLVVSEALLRVARQLTHDSGLALLLEDLHWADAETMEVVSYLADRAHAEHVLVACSLRDEGPTAALDTITRLEAQRSLVRLQLGPLSDAEVADMARQSLGLTELEPALEDLLRESAEGVPFLVEEVLAAEALSGSLVRTATGWQMTTQPRRIVPRTLAASVRERGGALGARGRALLGAAALLGRSFDWRLAARVSGCDVPTASALLEHALAVQLVTVRDNVYAFRHALTRDAVLEQLLPHERDELARKALDALESEPGDAALALRADLALAAALPDRAAESLLVAGRAALRSGALSTALTTLDRALDCAKDVFLRAAILEALTAAVSSAGDLARTEHAVAQLVRTLPSVDEAERRLCAAHLLLARCAVTCTRFELAEVELAEARRINDATADVQLAAQIESVAAQLAIARGDIANADALSLAAAAAGEQAGDAETVCEALEVASRCARTRDLREARDIAQRLHSAAERAGLSVWRMRALYQLGVVEMFESCGTVVLERARDEAARLGAVATMTHLDLEITAGLEVQFRIAEARVTCERCLEMAQVLRLRSVEAMAHAFAGILDAGRGHRESMEAHLDRALAIAGDDNEIGAALWGDARALASLALEDRARAREELERGVRLYQEPTTILPRLSTALLAMVHAVDGVAPDFAAAGGVTTLNAQGAGYLAYAHAVVLGRAGRADEAMAAMRRGDALLAAAPWYRQLLRRLAAEAALTDGWADPTQWLSEAAGFFATAGNDRIAAACAALLRRSGAKVARATARTRVLPEPLRRAGVTAREADVLDLVSEGLTNREIASRLFLSERTVEQHIAWLKQKLAVRSRAQLAVFAATAARG